ncbi:Uncharacterised protein [Candidatus Norongarragalina meridionalis]|nr:Uncharacterised protein [Candidatus Norongarragalina meridionalis]
MAATLDMFVQDAPLLLFYAVIAALVLFPLVFLMSFVYEALCKKWEKSPKILLMLLCTFIGVLAAALMLYFYLGASLTPAT